MFKLGYWIAIGALCAAVGCSSDSDDSRNGGDESGEGGAGGADDTGEGVPAVGESVKVSIKAEDGGDVVLGGAKLSVPADALAEDTDITLRTKKAGNDLPEPKTVQGPIYDFGPDGTEFGKPALLALPLPSKPASGETVVVSYLDTDSNTWKDLDTKVAGGSASAKIEHFTFFVVRFKGATGPVDCSFKACGGNIVGKWTVEAGCIDDLEDEAVTDCPGAKVDAKTDVTGDIEFKSDGTYAVALEVSGSVDLTIPSTCFGGATCAQLSDGFDGGCVGASDGCVCSSPLEADQNESSGTYETSGNTLTTTSEGDTDPSDGNEYCVSGNTLKVKFSNEGSTTVLVATKK